MFLNAGIAAVREVDSSIKIMLHLDRGGDNAGTRAWVDSALANNVAFDVLGLSCYTNVQGPPTTWQSNFDDLIVRYPNLQFMIVEYSETAADLAAPLDVWRQANDVMFTLAKKGLGAFVWEPTAWQETLFDAGGEPARPIWPTPSFKARRASSSSIRWRRTTVYVEAAPRSGRGDRLPALEAAADHRHGEDAAREVGVDRLLGEEEDVLHLVAAAGEPLPARRAARARSSGAKKNSRALRNSISQRSTVTSTLTRPASSSQRAQARRRAAPRRSDRPRPGSPRGRSRAARPGTISRNSAQVPRSGAESASSPPGASRRAARHGAARIRRVGQRQVRDADVGRAVGQHQGSGRSGVGVRVERDLRREARARPRACARASAINGADDSSSAVMWLWLVEPARQLQRQLAGGAADLEHARARARRRGRAASSAAKRAA